MHFWDWKTGYCFQKLHSAAQPGSLDSEAGIFMACFDVSGCRLLTAEADKTIKIYKEDETAVMTVYYLWMYRIAGNFRGTKNSLVAAIRHIRG